MPKAGEQATAGEIGDHRRGRIAHCRLPRQIRFVSGMPVTITGEARTFSMRERTIDEPGLGETPTA